MKCVLRISLRTAPSIDPAFEEQSSFYWSSTSLSGRPDHAWGTDFYDGYVNADGKVTPYFVRAVRAAP